VKWAALVVVAASAASYLISSGFDWREIPRTLERLDTVTVIAVMAVLPVFGFSVGIVYLVAGAKFGPAGGLAVIGVVTVVHLLGSHFVGRRLFRAPLERLIRRSGHRMPHIPEGSDAAVAAMIAITPGLPYVVRNYFLALSDIALRIYLPIAAFIYVARSAVAIFLGDFGTEPTKKGALILAAVFVAKLGIAGALLWHIRRRYRLTTTK
jgi:uncharacterized membrane protein YdjX (TVP38/TMEM64 family)